MELATLHKYNFEITYTKEVGTYERTAFGSGIGPTEEQVRRCMIVAYAEGNMSIRKMITHSVEEVG